MLIIPTERRDEIMSVITSVFIYYIVFVIATFFFIKADSASNDKTVRICILLGVLVLSFFASIRGASVGWDTYDTVNGSFTKLKYYNSFDSLWSHRDKIKEPVYWVMSYFIQIVTDDSRVFLFVVQLLTVGPVAIVAYDNRKKCSITIVMVAYMLLFYQVSLNIIRQSVSAAFLLLAVSKLFNKSYVKAILSGLISLLMHNSAILGLLLFVSIYIIEGNRNAKIRSFLIMICVSAGVVSLVFWRDIFNYLVEANVLSGSYDSYISIMSGEELSKYTVFGIRNIVFELIRILGMIIMVFALHRDHNGSIQEVRILKCSIVVSLVIYTVINLVLKSYLADRMTLYLDYMQLLLFAYFFPKDTSNNNGITDSYKSLTIPKTGVQFCLVYIFIFNMIVFMIYNYGHTLPFVLS